MHFPFGFSTLKATILKVAGIKYNIKGYNNPIEKLRKESLIR